MKRILGLLVALFITSSVLAQMRFVEATELTLIGKVLPTSHPYHRIDTTAYKGFTKSEKMLVRFPAGLAVVFKTNAKRIDLIVEKLNAPRLASTPRMSAEGFDLYIRQDGEWRYALNRMPQKSGKAFPIINNMDGTEKECLLYLPIYTEIGSLKIGVPEGATLEPMKNPFRHKIVIFGSSFTHGISTSRAGMSYPMQIARNTGLNFCSIACSGRCRLQPYFADYLADVKDADAMVFDAFSNPQANVIRQRLIPFIARIRESLPDTPLIFVQTIHREYRNFNVKMDQREAAKQEAAREMMAQAKKMFKNVYFIDKAGLTGDDFASSADGTHPSDLGYWRWAQNLQPELLKIFKKHGIR